MFSGHTEQGLLKQTFFKPLTVVIARTEPRWCWAFVTCLVPHSTGAVNIRSRNTVSDKECHPEI